MRKTFTAIISFLLCITVMTGCSETPNELTANSNAQAPNSDEIVLLNGYIALNQAEDMINKIFNCIEYLKMYRHALKCNNKSDIEKYSIKSSDIYMCGLHLWYDTSYENSEARDIRDMCDVIGVDFEKFTSYLLDIDSKISLLSKMCDLLTYYEETKNNFFFTEFDAYMENIDSWLAIVEYQDFNISLFELEFELSNYLEKYE